MNAQVIKNRIRKILVYSITGVIFLLVSGFLTLQIPAVQESIIHRYLREFSKITGFTSTIEDFELLWFDRLELHHVNIYDPAGNRMIGAKEILINFKLSHLFDQRDINIDGVYLDSAHVFLTKIPEGDTSRNLNINVFVHKINEHYASNNPGSGRSPRINIGEAILNQSQFSYIDQDREPIVDGFNYNQFTLDIDEAQLQNFLILGDTTQFNVNTLLAKDQKTKFDIKELSTFFRLSQRSMEFIGLNLLAGQSVVSDTVIFTFNGQEELSDFVPKVKIHARLHNTIIKPQDLALFAPQAGQLTQPVYISGLFNGYIDDFKFTDMEVGTGRTILRGSLDMEGLPDINETFIILNLKNSRLDFHDFSFLFKDRVLERLTPMGRVTLEGQFLGYPTDFVAKGEFSGQLGKISSDINFKVNENNFDKSVYSGKLALSDFNLGRYLNDTVNFQYVNLNGNVKGSGLTKSTADFTLNGKINSIGIRSYDYKNITTNARFASELFNGLIRINDPNLQISAKGTVDLRQGRSGIKLQAQIDTAYLQRLKLIDKDIFVHSKVDVNVKGLELDSLTGSIALMDFNLRHDNKWLSIQNIDVRSERTKTERKFNINTSLLSADVNGDFLVSDISVDIQKLVEEIILNIKNDKEAIADYYASNHYRPKSYQANFKVNVKNIDPVARLLNADLAISRNTVIEGKFTSGYTSILQAFTRFDSISYNQTLLQDTEVEFTASKIADSTNVLAMAFVNSGKQILSPVLKTKNLVAEAIWNNNHIDFGFDVDQDGQSNYMRLKGAVDFMQDSTQLKLLPSTLKLLEKIWDFDPNNLITIYKREVSIRKLMIRNDNQFVVANGRISPDPSKTLSLQINNFDLSLLSPVIGTDLSGTVNALFDVNNYYTNPYLQNDITIDSLTVDKFLVGYITGRNRWDTLSNRFLINFAIDRDKHRMVNVTGHYDPSQEANPLHVTAALEKAHLKILEPFLKDIFSSIDGTVTGDFAITGKLQEPAIRGEGQVTDAQVKIGYLQTVYRFTGTIGLTPNSIDFKNIELSDMFNNQAKLNGTINHKNFYGMRINIDASFQNFQVLNTAPKDNNLFYGQGYATGDLNIFGPISNLKITANARTDKNTRIFIPINGLSDIEKKEFIRFVSFTDSTFQQSIKEEINNKMDLTGISMDFNLDVTPDAYCEIIFDIKSGDIIRGRGTGELQLQLDTKGEFNMFGPFVFTEGWYNFTLYDIINKDFEIKKGSRITWYGDAYQGVLDIAASYNQLASFAPILSDRNLANVPQLRRKYPVQVLLDLDGPMLSPEINFDIITGDLPPSIIVPNRSPVRLGFEFQAFKNRIDEQELKRQVFSLIVLRRFSPPESFNIQASTSIANSVSELLSNQLSNWISQVDENLEIDIDLSTFDQEAYNTFQLRLSYTFFNGRLRITRDATTFYGNQNATASTAAQISTQQNSLANIAGDWTVDYLLTADGKLKVKMYNRTNFNPVLSTLGAQTPVTAGLSLSHTQSFNQLKDLWRSSRNRRKNTSAEDELNQDAIKNDEDDGTN